MLSILKGKNIFVTGAGGFLGKHVCSLLQWYGAKAIHNKHDLTERMPEVRAGSIDLVIHLAADIKGIGPNRAEPYRFLANNIEMALNVIDLATTHSLPIVAAGSVCAYCTEVPLPFNETDLWSGKPDENNLGYGMAKRFLGGALECAEREFGLRYAHLVSANLYGPGDHFDDEGAHVIPSLITRFHNAKINNDSTVSVWGTGEASRDMLYVEDAARAYINATEYLLEGRGSLECNIGSGQEHTIRSIAETIAELLKYKGELVFDTSKPDGQMRRRVDSNKADHFLEWFPIVSLEQGLKKTIQWYKESVV